MNIPKFIKEIITKIEKAGFEAYIVGGCVRDLLMDREPKDWDVTTNARPEDVLKIFPESVYENNFGTVLVKVKNKDGETEQVVEVTTYRSEQGYSDRRHPDEVTFEDDLEKDLMRRDFTVNAMAIRIKNYELKIKNNKELVIGKDIELIDIFGGQKDIKLKIIRAVGEPADRFKEDALRMMRAVRFACQLDFEIEPKTERAIAKFATGIRFVANERIKDELIKIISSDRPSEGIAYLYKLRLLNFMMPEMVEGKGVMQNHHHTYSVWKHGLMSLKYCPSKDWRVRMAAMLHDIGKPKSKVEKEGEATFYNHEYIGEKMTRKIMNRLKFSNEDIEKVTTLVRYHMFYYDAEEVTAASVRRLIKKVGKENLKDLIDIRIADRLGSGTPKAKPYKLRHLEYMFDKVQNDPVSVKMLKINGDHMIAKMGFEPGPKMGAILDVLLSEVIEEPESNNLEHLEERARVLEKDNLAELRAKAKEKIDEKRGEDDRVMKRGHYVK
jgi:tRNA nucleotidyltransferase (CCA-adding enzyme)